MIRKVILYIFLFPVFLQAQNIQKEFVWNELSVSYLNEKIKTQVLGFEGSHYHYKYGFLPVSTDRIQLSSDNDRLMVKFSDIISEVVPDGIIQLLDDKDKITDKYVLFTENIMRNEKPYADISVMPIRYNTTTNNYEKILSCKIHYEIVSMQTVGLENMNSEFGWNSVLSTGKWYRIATFTDGVHKITYSELKAMGMAVDNIDPRNIRIYGNGEGMIPESNGEERPDDLIENAISVAGEEDGSFDPGDCILFYAQGPVEWTYNFFNGFFEHKNNYYTDEVNYFITASLGPGKRIENAPAVNEDATHIVSSFLDYQSHEEDMVNVLSSGKFWFGEIYKAQLDYDYNFFFNNIDTSRKAFLRTNVVARSTETSFFNISYNGSPLINIPINKVGITSTFYAWSLTPEIVEFNPLSEDITISVNYDPTSQIATGWMDFIEINAYRKLVLNNGQLLFRDSDYIGENNIAEFHLNANSPNTLVWDITDIYNVKSKPLNASGSGYIFKAYNDDLYEYIAFDGSIYHSVAFIEELENQNLHSHNSVDFVIVTHEDFYNQAKRLADLHHQKDGLSYSLVELQDIYNEFSSGVQDIGAIRDYCRMIYLRGDTIQRLKYVLLFGNGSYDPKCRHIDNCSFVPTFQSKESLKHGYSFVCEDFFGLYDNDEGNNAYGKTIDVGVGRLPATSVERATQMVDKIEHYLSTDNKVFGGWRNDVCYIADDEDNNTHLKQAERLVNIVDTTYENFHIDKIYLDAFVQEHTIAGPRYPGVVSAINDKMRNGALIINYTGHGGETGLAEERIIDIPTINSWKNYDNMPLLITATCEFSRFDEPAYISAGELTLLNPKGGCISIFTTTRLAWSDPNFKLNRVIYENCFEKVNGEYPRLGDLVRMAKTEMYSSQNIKNFVLLGDPALQLNYPEYSVRTSSVSVNNVAQETDTLMALSMVTVSGQVEDDNGIVQSQFQGYVSPKLFDKKTKYNTIGNDQGSQVMPFTIFDKVLYEGKATVKNGNFTFSFLMPKDMNLSFGEGRLMYYAYDTITYDDAHGKEDLITGGMDQSVAIDQSGPDMSVFMENTSFQPGDYVKHDPMLLIRLYDDQGINHYNITTGKEITAILDDKQREPMKLNDFFEPDVDTYKSGWVYYPMDSLSDGYHAIKVKAWDTHGNSTEQEIFFFVNKNGSLAVNEVQNYPNPFSDRTFFVFHHNKPGSSFDVEIEIYDITGQEVARIEKRVASDDQYAEPVEWNGKDNNGNYLSRGIYPYRIRVWDDNNNYKEYSQKLIIGR